jgi:hypothetical protein
LGVRVEGREKKRGRGWRREKRSGRGWRGERRSVGVDGGERGALWITVLTLQAQRVSNVPPAWPEEVATYVQRCERGGRGRREGVSGERTEEPVGSTGKYVGCIGKYSHISASRVYMAYRAYMAYRVHRVYRVYRVYMVCLSDVQCTILCDPYAAGVYGV